jgi:hypothetical protein
MQKKRKLTAAYKRHYQTLPVSLLQLRYTKASRIVGLNLYGWGEAITYSNLRHYLACDVLAAFPFFYIISAQRILSYDSFSSETEAFYLHVMCLKKQSYDRT